MSGRRRVLGDRYVRPAVFISAGIATVSFVLVPFYIAVGASIPAEMVLPAVAVAFVWVVCLTARALARRKVRR